MNIFAFIGAFSKCKDAATANHVGGWLGTGIAAACGFLIAGGHVEQFRYFVCTASADDLGLAVAVIGAGASLLNSGTTKALAPTQNAPNDAYVTIPHDNLTIESSKVDNSPHNSELERVKQPFPVPRNR